MWIQAGWIAIGDLPGSMDGGAWLTWRLYCGAPTACGPAKNRRNGMSCVELTGLRADLPIGVMAALGCLRVLERTSGWQGSKLAWKRTGQGFHATLWTQEEKDREGLVAALIEDVKRSEERRVGKECRSRWSPYH